MFKVGDLIKFRANETIFKQTAKLYKNPGVVMAVFDHNSGHPVSGRPTYSVYWSDGKKTTEHESYLEAINKE
tara:strand:+ start:231 stop:446 length:216 start_codon:yes stop_codon:yes gene_type:complete